MQLLKRPDTQVRIAQLISEIEQHRASLSDEELDGWLIRRPSIFEIDDHFGMLFAESREGSAPLVLPESQEVCLGVITGEVRLDGYAGTLKAHQFFVIRPKDSRTIHAVQSKTSICCFFFRGPSDESGLESGLAPRQVA